MGVVPVSLASIHPTRNTVNAHEWNRHHAPLISSYLITSKPVSATLHVSGTVPCQLNYYALHFEFRVHVQTWFMQPIQLWIEWQCQKIDLEVKKAIQKRKIG